ncbi:MAG TPA: FtsX-like permease family protein [Candidatus Eisenbacteria bacterium]|nr:FtsX-like permease family protein [Candidatus Eisenbacteria bacterium]
MTGTIRALGFRPLRRHVGRTLVTLLGVAAGVAVSIGIDLAAQASIRSFSESARAVAGRAALRVHHRPLPLPESTLVALAPFQTRALLLPTLEAVARAHGPTGPAFSILGVDLLGDPRFAPERSAPPDLARARSLFDGGTLFIPEGLAARLRASAPAGAASGSSDSIDVIVGTRRHRFRIATIPVAPSDRALSASAGAAFLDIAPFQERFGRRGELDWIDIEARAGVDRAKLRADIAALLGADLRVEPPEERALQMERMLDSYRRNLRALTLVSLIVGVLLAYNALLSSVLQRRGEISLLRALGIPGPLLAIVFGIEALAVGLAGGIGGTLLGLLLARGSLGVVSRTVSELYGRITPGAATLTAEHWIAGMSLGLGAALLAAAGPLREAMRIRPLEFLREEHPGAPLARVSSRRLLAAAAAVAVALYVLWRPTGIGAGVRGYVGAGAALLAGSLLAEPFFTFLTHRLRPLFQRLAPPAGRIAWATALAARRRLGVAVAALLLAYAIVWGMASLVKSFRVTVDTWAGSTLRADLWVTPQSRAGSPTEGTMPAAWRPRLAALPEVADVDAFRVRETLLDGEIAFLGAGETSVLAKHGYLPLADGSDPRPRLAAMRGGRHAFVSEPLARRRGLAVGDSVALDSPTGRHRYEILAVYRDYASDRGYVVLDRETYLADFRDSLVSTYALYLHPGVTPERGAAAVSALLGPEEYVRLTDTRTIRREVQRVLRNTFAVTDALEIVAMVVALLSVLGTLAALVLERTREIGVLRAIGASRGQVTAALLLEGALLAAAGLLLGALTGILLSAVLVYVVNRESFGWTLALATPWRHTLFFALVLFAAALLAAVPPARRAASVPPREAMSRA